MTIDGVLMVEGLELVMRYVMVQMSCTSEEGCSRTEFELFLAAVVLGELMVFNFVYVVQIELVQVSSDREIVQDAGPNRR